eukprot:1141305-Pelagomonas_calceolata.AAC.10
MPVLISTRQDLALACILQSHQSMYQPLTEWLLAKSAKLRSPGVAQCSPTGVTQESMRAKQDH